MNYRKVAQRLKELGCEEIIVRGKGSHRMWENTQNNRKTTVPYKNRDLRIGTIKAILRQLEIDYTEFMLFKTHKKRS